MGYRIREVRESQNLTQSELALKSGVSRAIINGLETGRREVTTTETIKKIARALNCKVSDIFWA